MPTQNAAIEMDDVTRRSRLRTQPVDDRGVASLRNETDVLAVGLVGDFEAEASRRRAHLTLLETSQREAQKLELGPGGGEEEIALIATFVGRAVERRTLPADHPPRVMTGGERLCSQLAGHFQQVPELDRLIASHAGDRRLAAQIGIGEVIHHLGLEPALVVEDVVGNGHRVCGPASIDDVLTGATGALPAPAPAMIVELQGDTNDVIAGALEQSRGNGGIHASGHRRHDARAWAQGARSPNRVLG